MTCPPISLQSRQDPKFCLPASWNSSWSALLSDLCPVAAMPVWTSAGLYGENRPKANTLWIHLHWAAEHCAAGYPSERHCVQAVVNVCIHRRIRAHMAACTMCASCIFPVTSSEILQQRETSGMVAWQRAGTGTVSSVSGISKRSLLLARHYCRSSVHRCDGTCKVNWNMLIDWRNVSSVLWWDVPPNIQCSSTLLCPVSRPMQCCLPCRP